MLAIHSRVGELQSCHAHLIYSKIKQTDTENVTDGEIHKKYKKIYTKQSYSCSNDDGIAYINVQIHDENVEIIAVLLNFSFSPEFYAK